jgi:hypothetical protein
MEIKKHTYYESRYKPGLYNIYIPTREYGNLPEYDQCRKDESNKHSRCGPSELKRIPDARYEDSSKINYSNE